MANLDQTVLCADDAGPRLHTTTACNGEKVPAYLEGARHTGYLTSLIILDIRMPRMGLRSRCQIKADLS